MAKKKKKRKHRLFRFFVGLQIFLMLLVLGVVGYYYFGGYAKQVTDMQAEAKQMVRTSTEDTFKAAQTSVVYDAKGKQISTLKGEKDSYYLEYEEIPADVCAAITSIEDKKFYQHSGIDYRAILRAVKAMIENGEVTQGASTITQQLSRTIFLNQDKTWQRKVEEMFIAVNLEKKYSKTQILEFYLNNIYFGNGYYGIQAASKGYFNMEVSELDLSEIAFLCAIPNNPTLYDPLTNMENTLGRRNRILKNMYEDGKITKGAYDLGRLETIVITQPEKEKNNYVETYTYYCATRALMEREGFVFRYDFETEEDRQSYDKEYEALYTQCQKTLFTGGYRIYTSIDLEVQEKFQQVIDAKLANYTEVNEEGIFALQGAGVCIDNDTGHVKAIVGGRSQEFNGYTLNRAYQSFRQPGSAIKPLLVYTPALERGYTPDTVVTDQAIEDGPSNADRSYAGDMPLRSAVARSKNTVAWRLLEEINPKAGLAYLKSMNFSKIYSEDERPAAALGGFTKGVSPLEMASGYAAIENDGKFRTPTCIEKITDADENTIVMPTQAETEVYKTTAARMMTDMLVTVMESGTAKGLGLSNMTSAGKTGTTNDNKDGWFAGYTPYYTASVWVGYDMPKELSGLSGSSYPGSIWHEFMEQMHEGLLPASFLPYVSPGSGNREEDEEGPKDLPEENQPEEKKPTENTPSPDTPSSAGKPQDAKQQQQKPQEDKQDNADVQLKIPERDNGDIGGGKILDEKEE